MALLNVPGLAESDGIVFKAIPTGEYPVRISGIKEKQTKEKGAPMLEFVLKISEGEHADFELKTWILLPTPDMTKTETDRCVAKLKRLIVACNLNTTDNSFDTQDLMGGEFLAVVVEERKDGKDPVNNVKDYLPRK